MRFRPASELGHTLDAVQDRTGRENIFRPSHQPRVEGVSAWPVRSWMARGKQRSLRLFQLPAHRLSVKLLPLLDIEHETRAAGLILVPGAKEFRQGVPCVAKALCSCIRLLSPGWAGGPNGSSNRAGLRRPSPSRMACALRIDAHRQLASLGLFGVDRLMNA
jgi:hypothetical protein